MAAETKTVGFSIPLEVFADGEPHTFVWLGGPEMSALYIDH